MSSNPVGQPRRRLWWSAIPVLIAVMVGTGATAAVATACSASQQTMVSETLERRAVDVGVVVDTLLEGQVGLVEGVASAVSDLPEVSSEAFGAVANTVTGERFPGAGTLVFTSADRSVELTRTLAERGGSEQRLLNGAEAAGAMVRARHSGRASVSAAGEVSDERGDHPTAVVAGPVYTEAGDDTAAFLGWVLLTVRLDEALAEVLATAVRDVPEIDIDVWDVTLAGAPKLLAGTSTASAVDSGQNQGHVDLAVTERVVRVTTIASGQVTSGPSAHLAQAAMVGGGLITLLLAGVTWQVVTWRERTRSKVALATAALRADITRREIAETQLRDHEAELAGFIAVTAHDLRTPLTNVAAYADLLAEVAADDLDTTCLGFLDRISTGTRRMSRLINDLLDFATANNAPLHPEPVDLNLLCAEVITEHTAHLGDSKPNVDIGLLPTVQGDPDALSRLLDNLIGNAIKYVRHGDTAQISIGSRKEPDGWRIEVADRGIGIPAEQRQAVFAAFHRDRAAEGYPGTGLGLAICQRIVERHGGHIGIEANPGGGSRFWFTLPTSPPHDTSERPAADLSQASPVPRTLTHPS